MQHQKASGNRLLIELVEFRMYSGGAIRDIDKRRKTPKMSHVANQKKKKKPTSLHIWVRPSFSSKNDLRYEVLLIFINYQM